MAEYRFKIDENLPTEAVDILRLDGHEAVTVLDQDLGGSPDNHLMSVCRREERCIISLDTDFGDIRRYPPHEYHGIIVLRLKEHSRQNILNVLSSIVHLLRTEELKGCLWIADERKVRIRGSV